MHTVIYHNNCYDGVCAAWVMYKYLTETGKINEPVTKFKPCNYSDEPPWDLIDDANVYIVDFSWPREKMMEIMRYAKSLVVLDHHQTAQAALAGLEADNTTIVFDMNRSGAGLAWDYFFGKDVRYFGRPKLVDYVEDRDLWKYNLPFSREYNAYIQSFDIDLQIWVNEFKEGHFEIEYRKVGEALLRQQSKLVKEIAKHAELRTLPHSLRNGGIVTNPPMGIYVYTGVLFSEVCEQMLQDHSEANFAWYQFERKDNKLQVGLRSRAGSDVDVSEIAKLYGGGGHKHAAGFEL